MALRIVGIDYGKRRVGVAVADPLRLFAQPYGTYSQDGAVQALRELHAAEGIETVVVGWPLTTDGHEGPATDRVQEYLNRLANALKGVVVLKWDERYSSVRARDALIEAGVGRKARRRQSGRLDAAAAAVILQEYLDDTP